MSIKQGEYLKNLRNGKGISQDALGEALGISRQSVSKWEQGNSTPDIDNIGKLAEFYGVSIDSIVKGEADEAKENEQTAQSEEAKAVNELIDEFEGKEEPENKKAEETKFDMPISAPEPSLKEKELLKEQKDEKYILEREKEREERKKEKKRRSWLFPSYPILAVIAYCLIGVFLGANGWKIGWVGFLTIPLFYTGIIAIEKKKPIIFCYPVLVLIVFLLLGFAKSLWHPAWILFLTIPIFYIITAKAGKHKHNGN